MLAAPTESIEEINSTIDFASSSRLDVATFSVATPFPGTHLHDRHSPNDSPNEYSSYDYYKANPQNISELSQSRLQYYKRKAYLKFYLHPRRVGRTLTEFGTPRKALLKLKRF
jgi:hypothetical protein